MLEKELNKLKEQYIEVTMNHFGVKSVTRRMLTNNLNMSITY